MRLRLEPAKFPGNFLQRIALQSTRKYGNRCVTHIALAWLRHKPPVVAPIIGATKIPHLESAVESLAVRLTPEEVAYLEEPYVPHPLVGLIPYGAQS